MTKDPIRHLSQAGLYIVFGILPVWLFSSLLTFAFNQLTGSVIIILASALLANFLCLRIFRHVGLDHMGMPLNRNAQWNSLAGFAIGIASALFVVFIPVATGSSHFVPSHDAVANWRTQTFVPIVLLIGAAGEEVLFRGFGFQVLVRAFGAFSAILPIGVLFGFVHAANPNATYIGIANTAGFGMLFCYAFLRTHDIWFPLGMHYAWNLTLLLCGANISGITMRVTTYELSAGGNSLWTGGPYGPEGSLLTTIAIALLFLAISKAPIRRQVAYLVDCDPDEA